MSSRNSLASMLTACVLAAGFVGIAPAANAAPAAPSILKRGENNVIEIKRRGRGPRLYVPIAPNYLAYDYPYYYSRGHYPTRIGRGYVYYGYPYSYYLRSNHPRDGGRCSNWHRRCVAKEGRRQRGACRCR